MAIESLEITSRASVDISAVKNDAENSSARKTSFLDDISDSKNTDDNKKSDNKKSDKKKDELLLSDPAQNFLNLRPSEITQENNKEQADPKGIITKPVQSEGVASRPVDAEGITNNAILLRGLKQLSQRAELKPEQKKQLDEVKQNLAADNITENKALEIADEVLVQAQGEATTLVQNLSNGDITGNEFAKLTKINETLNKANGFGFDDEKPVPEKAQVEDITNKFNNIVADNNDKKLSKNAIENLGQLQRQLSLLQGYQLNVKDSIGPDGLVL